ncbi:hypothetical protein J2046_004218 [Rhizobium petrolearium]|nr:hypothetical protein [Neorhizobium petrolearium]
MPYVWNAAGHTFDLPEMQGYGEKSLNLAERREAAPLRASVLLGLGARPSLGHYQTGRKFGSGIAAGYVHLMLIEADRRRKIHALYPRQKKEGVLEIDRPLENGCCQIGTRQIGIGKIRTGDHGLVKNGPTQIGFLEIGIFQLSPGKIGALQFGSHKGCVICTDVLKSRPIGLHSLKIRPVGTRTGEGCPNERRLGKIGGNEIGVAQVRIAEIDIDKICLDEIAAVQHEVLLAASMPVHTGERTCPTILGLRRARQEPPHRSQQQQDTHQNDQFAHSYQSLSPIPIRIIQPFAYDTGATIEFHLGTRKSLQQDITVCNPFYRAFPASPSFPRVQSRHNPG